MKLFLKGKVRSQAAAVTCRTNKPVTLYTSVNILRKTLQYTKKKNSNWPNATRLCRSSGAYKLW